MNPYYFVRLNLYYAQARGVFNINNAQGDAISIQKPPYVFLLDQNVAIQE